MGLKQAEGMVESGQTDMYVRESGTPGSPVVVFLHAVGSSGAMWKRHMSELAAFHCLAPDLPGFGRSNSLSWTTRTDVADRVAELIHRRGPHRIAHVVGLSLGGSVAHTLLARHSDLLDRVVIDGCGVLPWWGTGLIKAGVTAISPFLHTRAVIGVMGKAYGLDQATQADMRRASPLAFRRSLADANETRLTQAELSASCPTLLVAGEREMNPPVRASNAALAGLMSNAEARYVAGRGHGWLGESPELHVRMVEAWITGQELPSELLVETTPWDRPAMAHLIGEPAPG